MNDTQDQQGEADHQFEPAICFIGECSEIIWAMTPAERLRKQFSSHGINQEISVSDARTRNGPVIFLQADAILDQPIIEVLARRLNLALKDEAGNIVAITTNGQSGDAVKAVMQGGELPSDLQLLVRSPDDLDASYWEKLRKKETPYALSVSHDDKDAIEWRMFMGTYKGATDFITKHIWPRPAFYTCRAIAPTFITPNIVTSLSAIMVVLAFWWFWKGMYIPGLFAAWAMTFLDTVDGKLARTTLTSSKWGDIFDHGIDLIHPPFWYISWGVGLKQAGFDWSDNFLWQILAVIFIGYVVQRIIEGISIKWLGIEIHIWRPIDTFFRQITARRNPNLALMTLSVLIGRPDWGLIAVAAWTVICLILHAIQLIQGFAAKPPDAPLVSWMRKQEAG